MRSITNVQQFSIEQYSGHRGPVFLDSCSVNVLEGIPLTSLEVVRAIIWTRMTPRL